MSKCAVSRCVNCPMFSLDLNTYVCNHPEKGQDEYIDIYDPDTVVADNCPLKQYTVTIVYSG